MADDSSADILGRNLDSVFDDSEDSKRGVDQFAQRLELDKQQREHDRDQDAKDIVSQSLRGVIRVISNIVILAIAAVSWHYLLPSWLSWLSENQLDGLIKFLLSSVVIGSVSNFFRQHALNS